MNIKFVQPTTLVDYPGKLACTIFLFGCNFRCGFCYNPELVLKEETKDLNSEGILDFLDKRSEELEGVCFTGGEPLMTLEEDFLRKVKEKGFLVKMDTNGSFPEKLKKFIEDNLIDYVAMDIKGTRDDYKRIVNSSVDLNKLEESIKIISNLSEYEFRTTVVNRYHNVEKILDEIKWVHSIIGKKIKKFCLQGFKNSGKFIDESFSKEKNISEKFLLDLKKEILKQGFVSEVIVRV